MTTPLARLKVWLRLDGETPEERIRNNPIQLFVIFGAIWITAYATYTSLRAYVDPLVAAIVLVLAGVVVGLFLRDFLLPSDLD